MCICVCVWGGGGVFNKVDIVFMTDDVCGIGGRDSQTDDSLYPPSSQILGLDLQTLLILSICLQSHYIRFMYIHEVIFESFSS